MRSLMGRFRARLHGDERGFTMIEVAIAMVIFGLLIVSVATSQSTAMNLIRTDRHRTVAANLAAEEMDTVRSTDFTKLVEDAGGRIETTRDLDGVIYTVTRDSSWVTGETGAGACDAPADADPRYLRVDVYVTWPVMSGVDPVTSNTIVTPPVGTFDEDSGHVAVQVLDRDAQPQPGVQVAITGPASDSMTTTADGCAFFAFLPAGDYTATVSATGHVNYQGESTYAQSAAVVVGNTTSLVFDYDSAATLAVSLAGLNGAPAPTTAPLVLTNTHLLPSGTKVVTGGYTVSSLFPFADGYGVRAGSCTDANVAASPVAVTPGATTAASVLLPEVTVLVEQDMGDGTFTPVEGAAVSASHDPDAGCPAGESYSIGATDASGSLVFALPYGQWNVTVNGVPTTVALTEAAPSAEIHEVLPWLG
jgi:prepilin-type N-terminal cleavage/methylation domain-containing protein